MTKKQIISRSFAHTLGLIGYIFIVANIMNNGSRWFGAMPGPVGGTVILTLFVLSAAVTASLFLGKPVLLYLEGDKKGAVTMVLYTIMLLAIELAIILTAAVLLR